jgi:hypothetical protein
MKVSYIRLKVGDVVEYGDVVCNRKCGYQGVTVPGYKITAIDFICGFVFLRRRDLCKKL